MPSREFSHWVSLSPMASAALPWIHSILAHQEINFSCHFHVVDAPTSLIALPLSSTTGLLIVSPPFDVINKPIHGKNSVQSPVCTFHIPFLYHHSPGNELQVICHDVGTKLSFVRKRVCRLNQLKGGWKGWGRWEMTASWRNGN